MILRTDLFQAKLQDFIEPILEEIQQSLKKLIPQIHSIYLYGSCAKGVAVRGKSDIDLTIVLCTEITYTQQKEIARLQKLIKRKYPTITKVDFDFGLLEEILNDEQFYRWGYWLKHCCRHLQGINLQEKFPPFKADLKIALALNQGFKQAIREDLQSLHNDNHPDTVYFKERAILKNQICKRLIRAINTVRPETETSWPYELQDYQKLFLKWYPEHISQLDYFYQLLDKDNFCLKELDVCTEDFITLLQNLRETNL